MADLDSSKHEHISKNEIGKSMPSNEVLNYQTTYIVQYNSDNYKHVMECINGLAKTVPTIAPSIQAIVASWKNKECHSDLDEVR